MSHQLAATLRDAAGVLRSGSCEAHDNAEPSRANHLEQLAIACETAARELGELRPALAGLYLSTIRLNLARPASLAAFTKARKHARIALGAKVGRRP